MQHTEKVSLPSTPKITQQEPYNIKTHRIQLKASEKLHVLIFQ